MKNNITNVAIAVIALLCIMYANRCAKNLNREADVVEVIKIDTLYRVDTFTEIVTKTEYYPDIKYRVDTVTNTVRIAVSETDTIEIYLTNLEDNLEIYQDTFKTESHHLMTNIFTHGQLLDFNYKINVFEKTTIIEKEINHFTREKFSIAPKMGVMKYDKYYPTIGIGASVGKITLDGLYNENGFGGMLGYKILIK